MSFELIESLWTEGRRPDGIPVRSFEEAREISRNWRHFIVGLED